MTSEQIALRKAYIDWLLQNADMYSHAATLTLKPYRIVLTENGQFCQNLSQHEAKQTFRFFINRLNASMFGNKAKKPYSKTIFALPIIEGGYTDKLLHYHCAFGNFPTQLSNDAINARIISAWKQTPFGNEQVDIKPMRNSGWISYISKEFGTSNTEVFDADNARLPNALLT